MAQAHVREQFSGAWPAAIIAVAVLLTMLCVFAASWLEWGQPPYSVQA